MSVSVLDLVAGRVTPTLNEAAPKVGGKAMWEAVEVLLSEELDGLYPNQGWPYMRDLLRALDTPLPRVLVTAWRSYEPLLDLVPESSPTQSGTVDLVQEEITAHWELAPRFKGRDLSGPRLVVDLKIEIDGASLVVEEGRIIELRAGTLTYGGSVSIKDAPENLATVGPTTVEVDESLLDFGDGFPIRPGLPRVDEGSS